MKRRVVVSVLGLFLLCGVGCARLHQPLPTGVVSAEADELARQIETAVGADAWAETGAISWTFAGRNHHLWDRRRNYVQVSWGRTVVWLDLTSHQGCATVRDRPVSEEKEREYLDKAYAMWANDSFWLNPLVKLFDDGTSRALVAEGDRENLLVTYSSGGVTPGDSYLWTPGPDMRPTAWQMWVSVIPWGGVSTTWEGWTQLSTGAWIATEHGGPLGLSLKLTDVHAATSLTDLLGAERDPFGCLWQE